MPCLWITYAWKDNEARDVDYIAQELKKRGVNVRLDRWALVPGQRLWEQIDRYITDEQESDAWMIFATPTSLGSEPCREEIAYALDRALSKRGAGFPIIALFAGSANLQFFPSVLKTRLCVDLENNNWVEQVVAGCNQQSPPESLIPVDPFIVSKHDVPGGVWMEFRPRSGVWANFSVSVPIDEAKKLVVVTTSTPGVAPQPTGLQLYESTGRMEFPGHQVIEVYTKECLGSNASPAVSGFAFFNAPPSQIIFGSLSGMKYRLELEKAV